MSADNGIYILETSGPEYRVVHTTNIEDIEGSVGILDPEWTVRFFGKAEVFANKEDANKEADRIYEEMQGAVLEYGICLLDYSNQKFPTDKPEWSAEGENSWFLKDPRIGLHCTLHNSDGYNYSVDVEANWEQSILYDFFTAESVEQAQQIAVKMIIKEIEKYIKKLQHVIDMLPSQKE